MTVKKTHTQIDGRWNIVKQRGCFKDIPSDKTFKISAVGYDTDARKVVINNLYS